EREVSLAAEPVAEGLRVPWSISFISDDEALFTERHGSVKLLDLSSRRVEDVGSVEVAAVGEGGLLGVETLKRGGRVEVFLYHTYSEQRRLLNKVVRTVYNGSLEDRTNIITSITGGSIHDGGRLKIGPDGMLYITTGEGGMPAESQNINSLGGKILRIRPDGTVPDDNPFKTPVHAYGLRNPQGIAWLNGKMYCTDHGPSGEEFKYAHDEVNLVVRDGNYGWPLVIGDEVRPGLTRPLIHSGTETWAPSGCCIYQRGDIDFLRESLLFAALRGTHLHKLTLNREGDTVVSSEKLFNNVFGRLRDVVEGPDGALYVLTSNRDGRGVPRQGDDKIIRIAVRS
ncbi:MAG: PQQ-dependent sugar dehydrogenase, partial [Candidatus Caldarchaeum sp.]|nr:PQQ-dependent sugar dehydrogenase [Candidatus Caldarchaeum sp.]MDW7978310.1 PQQ-dependent sugar dehydrogenase [Candidatus Caldarchaeum sp.]